MAPKSNFISDIAKMANGAATALGGLREEIDNMIRLRMERTLNARGLVTREEFEALRTRHEAVAARLAVLEIHFAADESPPSEVAKSSTPKAAKTSSRAKKTSSARKKSTS